MIKSLDDVETAEKHPDIIQFKDKRTNLIGFKKKNGRIIVSAQYKSVYDFNIYGIAEALYVIDGAWYKINTSGQHLAKSYLFDNGPDDYISGLSRFEQNSKLGFVNFKGDIVIPAKFDWVTPFMFSEPIAVACIGCTLQKTHKNHPYPIMEGGKWGVINKEGNVIIPFDFTGYTVYKGYIIMFQNSKAYKICTHCKTIEGAEPILTLLKEDITTLH